MNAAPLHSHFSPSKDGEAALFSPADYVAMGSQFERGDRRRVMSRSELMEFARCPHRWKEGVKDEETDSTEWGSLVDCLLLTPKEFEGRYAIAPETYPETGMKCEGCGSVTDSKTCAKCKRPRVEVSIEKPWNWNSNYCEKWRTEREAEGQSVIKSELASAAHLAVARLKEDERIFKLVSLSKTQVLVRVDYTDDDTGLVVPIKCLLDIVPDPQSEFGKMLADLKTDRNAAPEEWRKTVFKRGYHTQAAMYLDAYNAANGTAYTQFAHIVQENFPPYEGARRLLDPEFIQLGRATYRRALADYCHCLKHDFWPGYDDWNVSRGEVVDGWRVASPLPWMIGAPE